MTLGGLFILASTVVVLNGNLNIAAATSSCDKVNIVRCGLSGSTAQSYIESIQQLSSTGSDGYGNSDLGSLLTWGGYSSSVVNSMNTSNSKIGTLYRNGEIWVDDTKVATAAWISARFSGGSGFEVVKDGVWARLSTTSMQNASDQVLVTFDGNGKAIAATVIRCGNMLRFTPVTPPVIPPAPAVECTSIQTHQISRTEFSYDAASNPTNGATVTGYVFSASGPNFSKSVSISSSASSVNSGIITFPSTGTYTVAATVKTSLGDKSGSNCTTTTVVLPEPTPEQVVVCDKTTGKTITVNKKDEDAYLPVGSTECKPKVLPAAIIKTGPTETLLGLTGISSLGYGAYGYLASRRAVRTSSLK